jgi:hypothetical protein
MLSVLSKMSPSSSMPDLRNEHDLELELLRIYHECGRLGYWARRWYQMFMPHCARYVGGIETVRKTLATGGQSLGISTVRRLGRLDLTVEHIVLDSGWTHLFTDQERTRARKNLAGYSRP